MYLKKASKGRGLHIMGTPRLFKLPFLLELIFLPLFVSSHPKALKDSLDPSSLPPNFLFGTASSSYQFEGAYLSDGKGLSNWDIFTHTSGKIIDGSNGDIAVDQYHRFLEDIDLMETLGVNSYRFSISWARILPKGRFGDINRAGISYYNKLINALLLKGIQPFVTLTHYDMPQELEERYGGWLSPKCQEDFGYYVDICFKYFGDRVNYWVTFNEPNLQVINGYRTGESPPSRCSSPFGNCTHGDSEKETFLAAHNIILAHANAVHIYRTKYQKQQGGSIGIVIHCPWFEPYSNSTADNLATDRAQDFLMNWFLDPIIFGKYPAEMTKILGSAIPKFSSNDREKLNKGLDFIGINHYTGFYIQDCSFVVCKPGQGGSRTEGLAQQVQEKDGVPIGKSSEVDWIHVYPQGMEKIITYLKERYNNTPMIITENGFGQESYLNRTIEEYLQDRDRVEYMSGYLDSLMTAMLKGADVRGYFAWSLLDNFEWGRGYTRRFGLHHVDYTTLKRIPRLSATWFKEFIARSLATFGSEVTANQMHKAVYQCNRFITSTKNTNQDSGSPDLPLAATVLFFSAYAESFLTFMRDSKGRALLIRELPSNFQVMFLLVLIFVPLCVSSHPETLQESLDHFSLPDNFLFGMASSSYQFEGSYLSDGKGLSNWDMHTHTPGKIIDGSNGDIAADQYHLYPEDIDLMDSLGVSSYRFSISWARILPRGRFGDINKAGISYYNKLIDSLLLKGIQPFVTLVHYDIPEELEERYGGWLSPRCQEDFGYYADICFKNFGDRVKYWTTFNEPNIQTIKSYRSGEYPPCHCSSPFGNCTHGDSEKEPFIAAHNMILAHATAVDVYRTKYQKEQGGNIGIVLDCIWFEQISNSTADKLAADRAQDFFLNWFLDPIIFGNYPAEMSKILGSTLPKFSSNDKEKLKNGLDFIGINHYTSEYVQDCIFSVCEPGTGASRTEGLARRSQEKDGVPIGIPTDVDWLHFYPQGMEKMVTYIKKRYNNKPMIITENGYGQQNNPNLTIVCHDIERVEFMSNYWDSLLTAMEKGADVRGYFAWSLLDNFEWTYGYTQRYGLYHVDFTTLKRTPKLSAAWFKEFIARYKVDKSQM